MVDSLASRRTSGRISRNRLSEEYLELSRKNKENSQKVMNPHHLGSRGNAKKMPEFEAELQKMDRLAEEGI